jgi:hypothetical protein
MRGSRKRIRIQQAEMQMLDKAVFHGINVF